MVSLQKNTEKKEHLIKVPRLTGKEQVVNMISQVLRDAHRYEESAEKMIAEEDRPVFHLSARTGWLNDPNGFSYYDGKYHLFYQYHPYDPHWGPMHWGHAVSEDLLHWTYYPAALAPDEVYDKDGCFSGSAVTLDDGRHLLMYTGVVKEQHSDGTVHELQTQCLAVGDGTDYEKYVKNPVIDSKALPEGCSHYDFRDPKMWRKKDGTYCCVIGNRSADGSGQILLFSSQDGFVWKYEKVLISNCSRFGKMWECPDFFELDGKWVLLTSPMDMLPSGFEYHNGNGTLCLIGDFDEEQNTFTDQHDQSIDYGIDFYAPQTIVTPDGRRVMIGWMQNWDTCSFRTQHMSWFGQMSLPRELSIKNGRLCQNPIKELEQLRKNQVVYRDVSVSGIICLDGIHGRRIDIEIAIAPEEGKDIYRKFAVHFAQNEQFYTSLSFHPGDSILKIDRKFSGSRRAIIHQRRSQVNSDGGKLKLRIILDRFSAEVFVNDGEQVLTAVLYTEQSADGIRFLAEGIVKMNVVKYDLGAVEK